MDYFIPTNDLIELLKSANKAAKESKHLLLDGCDTVFDYAIAKIEKLTAENESLRKKQSSEVK